MKKLLPAFLLACCVQFVHAQIRMTYVNPVTQEIRIRNFGTNTVDVSTYRLCGLFEYANLSQPSVAIVSGDYSLSAYESVTIHWTASTGFNTTASDIGLYLPSGAYSDPASMVDFMQYGAGGQGREGVAAAGGRWTAGAFATGTGPWYYTGNGQSNGLANWSTNAVSFAVFQVDMSNASVSANGVHIAGSFQGWSPSASSMTLTANGVYVYQAALAAGGHQFKYVNGNAWGADESVPAACGVPNGSGGFNRNVTMVAGVDQVLNVVCFASCAACAAPASTIDVTMRVNMSAVTVGANGVHVAGNFQGWQPNTSAMTDLGNGVYEITFTVEENAQLLYKFINGNAWTSSETVPAACGLGDGFGGYNRVTQLGSADTTISAVCFATCDACEVVEPVYVDVTLQVDLSQVTVAGNGVFVIGNFDGGNAPGVQLTDSGNGIFTTTITTLGNTAMNYIFINGGPEGVAGMCTTSIGGNNYRTLLLDSVDVVVDTVCFASCTACQVVQPPATIDVTFQVNMSQSTVSSNGVHVAGNFQGWNPAGTELTDADGDGVYAVTVTVDENSNLSYKFINGNTWAEAESVPSSCGLPDGNGGYNRILETGAMDVIANVVCFSSCIDCEVVNPADSVIVTFLVNMANESVSANGVHIAGSMQGWNPAAGAMTDANADGIYEWSTTVPANSTMQFKFINDNTWGAGEEVVPAECGAPNGFGGFNREWTVADADTTYGPVCFSSCADCQPFTPVLVTFRVDMSNQTVSADGVFMTGDFNNWSLTETPMSEYEPNHYQAVVVLNANTTINYKFLNGSAWTGAESVPVECGADDGSGNINRSYAATDVMETLPLVCFNECAACVVIDMVDVTFQVDMSQQVIDPTGVYVAGSFNGFSSTATPMTLTTPGVYTATISVMPNTSITFKYLNGSTFAGVESVPFECGVDDGFGGYNRSIVADVADITMPVVCFSSCAACPAEVLESASNAWFIYPNPASEWIQFDQMTPGEELAVYNAYGMLVTRMCPLATQYRMNVSEWSVGIYTVLKSNGESRSFIVR